MKMLTEVAQTIGWHDASDRETIIRREHIERAIPSLQAMQQDLVKLGGRSVQKYVEEKGVNTVHDVLVVLRRLARQHGHAVVYRRASKNKGNTPVYLYQLL